MVLVDMEGEERFSFLLKINEVLDKAVGVDGANVKRLPTVNVLQKLEWKSEPFNRFLWGSS